MKKIFMAGAITSVLLLIAAVATVHGFYAGWLVKDSPEYDRVNEEYHQLQQRVSELETEVAENKEKHDSLSNKELVVVGEVPAEEVDKKENDLESLEQDVLDQELAVRVAKTELDDANQLIMIIDRGQEAIDLYKANYPVLENPGEVIVQQKEAATTYAKEQEELSELQQEVSALKAEVNLLAGQDAQLEQAQFNRKSEIEDYASTISELQAELSTNQAELLRVTEERSELMHWTQAVQNWAQNLI
jgi:peptidoglycan hydrolase CwlO-like protein